jgi:hypothetical protein
MSTREYLPSCGHDIGAECIVYETKLGFSASYAGCWLPGTYQTFEAAERSFELSDDQIFMLCDHTSHPNKCITLYDIEQVLE